MNLLLTLRFVGTAYGGFQIQDNAPTVQGEFQRALESVLGYRPDIKGCSRTDSGVHANKFCISMKLGGEQPRLAEALNAVLPDDIRVIGLREVADGFHARYSCIAKRYVYLVYNSRYLDPFLIDRAISFAPPIDCEALTGIARTFVGKHDFSAFCGAKNIKEDNVRTVRDFSVARDGELVRFSVSADGFLYNMVRIMVGTMLNAARGKLGAAEIAALLESGARSNLCYTAPACGLYLDEVFYDFGDADER